MYSFVISSILNFPIEMSEHVINGMKLANTTNTNFLLRKIKESCIRSQELLKHKRPKRKKTETKGHGHTNKGMAFSNRTYLSTVKATTGILPQKMPMAEIGMTGSV